MEPSGKVEGDGCRSAPICNAVHGSSPVTQHYDAAIIGTGQAGLPLANHLQASRSQSPSAVAVLFQSPRALFRRQSPSDADLRRQSLVALPERERTKAALPGARLVTLPNTGHFSAVEKPRGGWPVPLERLSALRSPILNSRNAAVKRRSGRTTFP